jgi:hypothetical protein
VDVFVDCFTCNVVDAGAGLDIKGCTEKTEGAVVKRSNVIIHFYAAFYKPTCSSINNTARSTINKDIHKTDSGINIIARSTVNKEVHNSTFSLLCTAFDIQTGSSMMTFDRLLFSPSFDFSHGHC